MNLLHAMILGVVEGATEFLPISSTGHLILTSHLLKIPASDFLTSFEIAIQVGAIAAVLFLYGKSVIVNYEILKRVLVAFLPTAMVGLVFYHWVKNYLLKSTGVVLWALFWGGLFLVIFEWLYRPKEKASYQDSLTSISYKQCFWIGVCQSLAIIPGVSRSAATIVGGLVLGITRRTIVEFSFLLAVPTLLAATGLDLVKHRHSFSAEQSTFLLAGFLAAFFTAILSIRFLLEFIKNHRFASFGVYRMLVALLFWFII